MRIWMLMAMGMLVAAGCATHIDVTPDREDLDGVRHHPLGPAKRAATVIIFITNDCPIANSYAPEINRLVDDYSGGGSGPVEFFLVHVDPQVSADQAREHARQHGFKCPVLLDGPYHTFVKDIGATVTPEAAVINARGELAYRGRIDDWYTDFGKKRAQPSQRDLRNALDAILAGKPVPVSRTRAIGCFIPGLPRS